MGGVDLGPVITGRAWPSGGCHSPIMMYLGAKMGPRLMGCLAAPRLAVGCGGLDFEQPTLAVHFTLLSVMTPKRHEKAAV